MKHSGIAVDRWPLHVQDQIAAKMALHPPRKPAEAQGAHQVSPATNKPSGASRQGKARLRQDRTGPNKTEVAFDAYLRADDEQDHVMRESITLRIGNGVRYTPDFTSQNFAGVTCLWEVKGFLRDDAAVKVKVAASLFPFFFFYLVTKRTKKQGGGWSIERVLP